ncbi:ABC transporter ATP-binding protein [Candidatus Woesearchaeota archaeon]|nr:ABC transporter ATP-binding protein [Candidatus Woesearchaeota archaeon]
MEGQAKGNSHIIHLDKVWKTYLMGEVKVHALRGVSLTISRGDFVAITGSSGSGKSTMMNLVGCLDLPTQGAIFLDHKDISRLDESDLAQIRGRKIGFIFQQFHLIPTLTALENVMLPLEFQDIELSEARKMASSILEKVGLGDRMHHLPGQLSGGQQQRVAIARSLANNPEVILADEPTGNLDSVSGANVLGLLETLWKKEHKTIIMVTHDSSLAKHARRVVQLKDGRIVEEG